MEEKLRIAEIFTSIQGEGVWAGIPSTFIRVSGCNLRCVWCDTPYASWNPEGPILSLAEILTRVEARHVVLTGGEPMLFEPVVTLARRLRDLGHIITIETAGTVFRELDCDLMSISPKLSNSAPPDSSGWRERHEKTRQNLETTAQLLEHYDCQIKFVISKPDDLLEVDDLLEQLPAICRDRILLMAEGVTTEVQRKRQRWLSTICIERGWRLSPRLHIDLFGNTRGT